MHSSGLINNAQIVTMTREICKKKLPPKEISQNGIGVNGSSVTASHI